MGPLTAGQVKTAYVKHLRAGLRGRGFRGGPEGKFDRVREGGTNNLLMAVLARRLGRDPLVREILAAHQADLDRRGADQPAFEPNRRWRASFAQSTNGGG